MNTLCTSNELCNGVEHHAGLTGRTKSGLTRLPVFDSTTVKHNRGVFGFGGGFFKSVLRAIRKRYQQHIDRQAFNRMLSLDDNLLKDIGVSRADVRWASQLPLSQDAAVRLETLAGKKEGHSVWPSSVIQMYTAYLHG